MSLQPLVFRRVPRLVVVPEAPRKTDIIETTGVEIFEVEVGPPVAPANRDEGEAPVPFASTLRHI